MNRMLKIPTKLFRQSLTTVLAILFIALISACLRDAKPNFDGVEILDPTPDSIADCELDSTKGSVDAIDRTPQNLQWTQIDDSALAVDFSWEIPEPLKPTAILLYRKREGAPEPALARVFDGSSREGSDTLKGQFVRDVELFTYTARAVYDYADTSDPGPASTLPYMAEVPAVLRPLSSAVFEEMDGDGGVRVRLSWESPFRPLSDFRLKLNGSERNRFSITGKNGIELIFLSFPSRGMHKVAWELVDQAGVVWQYEDSISVRVSGTSQVKNLEESWNQVKERTDFGQRWHHSCVEFGGQFRVIGGFVDVNKSQLADPYLWSSPDGISWSRSVDSLPFGAKSDIGLASFAGRLWAFGGYNPIISPGGYSRLNSPDSLWATSDGEKWEVVPFPLGRSRVSYNGAYVDRDTLYLWSQHDSLGRDLQDHVSIFAAGPDGEFHLWDDFSLWSSSGNKSVEGSALPWDRPLTSFQFRYSATFIYHEELLWSLGGLFSKYDHRETGLKPGLDPDGLVATNAFTRNGYDWTVAESHPAYGMRIGSCGFSARGKMWMMGGLKLLSDGRMGIESDVWSRQ